jgi:hypothetical protein
VDDMPHHTCTSPDYQGRAEIAVRFLAAGSPDPLLTLPTRRPLVLDAALQPPVQTRSQEFTTAQYRGVKNRRPRPRR